MFKENISVKIVGRGFDDFSTSPVVVYQGRMMRCNADIDLSTCLNITKSVDDSSTVRAHKQPSSSSAAAVPSYSAFEQSLAIMAKKMGASPTLGTMMGILWASGNFMSVHATYYLGRLGACLIDRWIASMVHMNIHIHPIIHPSSVSIK